jgi:hypothetical protein
MFSFSSASDSDGNSFASTFKTLVQHEEPTIYKIYE